MALGRYAVTNATTKQGKPELALAAAILYQAKLAYGSDAEHLNRAARELHFEDVTAEVEAFLASGWFQELCGALKIDPDATAEAIRKGSVWRGRGEIAAETKRRNNWPPGEIDESILALVPGTAPEIAAQLPYSRRAINKHLRELCRQGVLKRERINVGRRRLFFYEKA